jgi:hypothetical protein
MSCWAKLFIFSQNQQFSGLCPTFSILKPREHNVSETGAVSVLRWLFLLIWVRNWAGQDQGRQSSSTYSDKVPPTWRPWTLFVTSVGKLYSYVTLCSLKAGTIPFGDTEPRAMIIRACTLHLTVHRLCWLAGTFNPWQKCCCSDFIQLV